jgi:hypothetical protein
LPSLLWEHGS